VSEPGTELWRRVEVSRLIAFWRRAALPDDGFRWLDANGVADETRPRPLYLNTRMTCVFALGQLRGVAGAGSLAAPGQTP
jgi:sulfoquinovose isomerase